MPDWYWWDGCYAAADGCKYCYFYGQHSKRFGQNNVTRANDDYFYAPLDRKIFRSGDILVPCLSTDFFIPEADEWRKDAWRIIKERSDIAFKIVTKRIDRFNVSLPDDWGDGYDNVEIMCGIENRETAEYRLPLFLSYPIKYKNIGCVPMIGEVDLSLWLHGVQAVSVSGEWGKEARELDYDWVLKIREQCISAGVSFDFGRTGQRFRKDGVLHKVSPFRKKAALTDLGVNNIAFHVKSDVEKFEIRTESDRTFLLAFDQAMNKLGYDFDIVLGKGTEEEPYILNYLKLGTLSCYAAARVYISDGSVSVKLRPKKLTPHFKYIQSAPAYIREIYTAQHDECANCATKCRTQKKYVVDGFFIQKCRPHRFIKPMIENLPDYMDLFLQFYPEDI